MRVRLMGLAALAIGAGALWSAAPALAQLDATSTAVSCAPASLATGSATTCTATVTDIAPTPQGTPTGTVTFTAAPDTGAFGSAASCLLGSGGASASCQLTFTPAAGGDYRISGAYGGDSEHEATNGSFYLTAIDTTSTSFTCASATLQIDTSTECTATIGDPSSPQAPIGSVTFSSSPSTGTFGPPGVCNWTTSGSGGGAKCNVTFAPADPGRYTLTAAYSGDSSHSASSGTFSVTATTTPAGGGPASQPGSSTLTISVSSGPPPPATLTLARRATVSKRHRAALKLSCAGAAHTRCSGKLTLADTLKIKVKVKVKVKTKSKGRHARKPKTTTTTKTETVILGSIRYGLAAGRSHTYSLRVSKPGQSLLASARRGRLSVTAYAANFFTQSLTLYAPKERKHKHHKRQKKKN